MNTQDDIGIATHIGSYSDRATKCDLALLFALAILWGGAYTVIKLGVALFCLSVFSTALAFVIYFRLVGTLGSVGTTAQAYLRVPIGVAISIMFLGEKLSATAWAGLVCIVAGVAVMTMPERTRRVPSAVDSD